MKTKRIFAYIIDIVLISVVANLIFGWAYRNTNYAEFLDKNKMYIDQLTKYGSTEPTEEELIDIAYDLNKIESPLLIITLGLTVFYFGIVSFVFNGQTIGKKILHIKVVPMKGKKLNPGLYMIRELILTNSIFKLLDIINVSVASKPTWAVCNTILTYCENFTIIILLGVMIFRNDERSLHDIICKTNVIELEKEK